MANLTESATYDVGVYQLETTDPVVGGSTGVSNAPLKNLANRTAYLKQHLDALESSAAGFATLVSPTFTGSPAAPTPALGDADTSLATTAFVQMTVGGYLSKSVAGGSNVTLSAIEAGNGILEFNGALTASINVIVPTSPTRPWIVFNNTTGAFGLTIKTSTGTGVTVPRLAKYLVYNDGTNVIAVTQDVLAQLLTVDGAGSGLDADLLDGVQGASYARIDSPTFTGVPAAPTATAGTNTTQIATTAFVTASVNAATGGLGSMSTQNTNSAAMTANCTIDGVLLGYRNIPQDAQAAAYTLVLADSGKHIYYTGAAANITVPLNSAVAYPVGTAITLINNGSGNITIVTTSLTVYWAGTAFTGNRTLAPKGLCTLVKVDTDTWFITGAGLS